MAVNVSYNFGDSGSSNWGWKITLSWVQNGECKRLNNFETGTATSGTFTADDNTLIAVINDKSVINGFSGITATGGTFILINDSADDGYLGAVYPTSDSVTITF